MSTFNAASSTNCVNPVLWSYSTRLVWHTDRDVSGTAKHGIVESVDNLGVGVAAGDPFSLLT